MFHTYILCHALTCKFEIKLRSKEISFFFRNLYVNIFKFFNYILTILGFERWHKNTIFTKSGFMRLISYSHDTFQRFSLLECNICKYRYFVENFYVFFYLKSHKVLSIDNLFGIIKINSNFLAIKHKIYTIERNDLKQRQSF